MTRSRITVACGFLIGLMLWLAVACGASAPDQTTPTPENRVRLFTRTPVPIVTPTPTLHPQAVYQQGLARRDAWDLETALDRFNVALTLAPNALFFASRAEVYRLTSRYEEAAADIERALAIDPELAEAWRQNALLNRVVARWDEALSAINKLIDLTPDDGAAYVLRAQIYDEGFGNIRQALADYDQAISYDPGLDKATLVERWRLLAELGRWEDAHYVSVKMTISGSTDPLRFFYRGWSLIKLGRLDEAIQRLFMGINRYPDYPVALYYALGVAYYERQAWSEAVQALEVALLQSGASSAESTPKNSPGFTDADILGYMGVAYLELKQCETGAAIVERAVAESLDLEDWTWARPRIEACYVSLTPTPTPEDVPTP